MSFEFGISCFSGLRIYWNKTWRHPGRRTNKENRENNFGFIRNSTQDRKWSQKVFCALSMHTFNMTSSPLIIDLLLRFGKIPFSVKAFCFCFLFWMFFSVIRWLAYFNQHLFPTKQKDGKFLCMMKLARNVCLIAILTWRWVTNRSKPYAPPGACRSDLRS